MIYSVPDPPPETKITVERDAYELRLSWGGRRSTGRLVLSLVGAALAAALTAISQLFPGIIEPSRLGSLMLNVAVGLGVLAFIIAVFRSYRALAPESVRLDLERLVHTAGGGRSGAAAPSDYTLRPWRVEIRRVELRDVTAGKHDGKDFVALASGRSTRDIGWGLGDADREWLVSVLKRWKESAG